MEIDDTDHHHPGDNNSNSNNLSYYLSQIPAAVSNSLRFQCEKCSHSPTSPWPPIILPGSTSSIVELRVQKQEVDMIREELVCYHSRVSHLEDTLGVGIHIQRR